MLHRSRSPSSSPPPAVISDEAHPDLDLEALELQLEGIALEDHDWVDECDVWGLEPQTNSPTHSAAHLHQWSTDDEELYHNKLVDRFVDLSMDAFKTANVDLVHDIESVYERQTKRFADIAMKHYNDDQIVEVEYELIKGTESCFIMDCDGCYAHVNFIAKAKQEGSTEQLFFAEVCLVEPCEVSCFCSLEGREQIGGYLYDESKQTSYQDEDRDHCYACGDAVKHPSKDVGTYGAGHYTLEDYY